MIDEYKGSVEGKFTICEVSLLVGVEKFCDFIGVHQKTVNESSDLLVSYDAMNCDSVGTQRHLIDILSRLQVNHERDSIFALFHQMTIVAKTIWFFGLDVKPLRLFSNQEVSLFFQSGLPGKVYTFYMMFSS